VIILDFMIEMLVKWMGLMITRLARVCNAWGIIRHALQTRTSFRSIRKINFSYLEITAASKQQLALLFKEGWEVKKHTSYVLADIKFTLVY